MVDKKKLFDVDLDEETDEEEDWSDFMSDARSKKKAPAVVQPSTPKRGRGRPKNTKTTKAKTIHLYVDQLAKLNLERARWKLESGQTENSEALSNSAIIRILLEVFEPAFKDFEGIENEDHLREEILKIIKL